MNGSCMNTGHYCCGTERIYVVDEVHDAFVDKVTERTRALRQSDTGESDVGAVFWDEQMKIIESHMEDARAKGANVLVGGRRNPELKGLYFEPTVVTDVTHDMDLMTKETFGPIVSIMKVADEEEALSRANDSEYGLNGNVWTKDTTKGLRLAERLDNTLDTRAVQMARLNSARFEDGLLMEGHQYGGVEVDPLTGKSPCEATKQRDP